MTCEVRTTTDALEIIDHLIFRDEPNLKAILEVEDANNRTAVEFYNLREKAGLSQEQLAEKAGTTAEIVDRIELNDFEEFSVEFMQQYARALGKRLEVRIVESEVIVQQAEAKDQPAA